MPCYINGVLLNEEEVDKQLRRLERLTAERRKEEDNNAPNQFLIPNYMS